MHTRYIHYYIAEHIISYLLHLINDYSLVIYTTVNLFILFRNNNLETTIFDFEHYQNNQ